MLNTMTRQFFNYTKPINWQEFKNRLYEFAKQNNIINRNMLCDKIWIRDWTIYHITYNNKVSLSNIQKLKKFIQLDDIIDNKSMDTYETK